MPSEASNVILKASVVASAFSVILVSVGIFCFSDYGVALFLITPLLSGFISAAIIQKSLAATKISKLKYISGSAVIFCLLNFILLMVCGVEGAFCMIMAFPLVLVCFLIGMLIAFTIPFLEGPPIINLIICLIFVNLLCGFVENKLTKTPELFSVNSSLIIKAKPEEIWQEVIAFRPIPSPKEFIFTHGISYPIRAEIVGQGVGAIRYCRFNSGDLVEPITEWEENRVLGFDVSEQPLPMKELSIWDIDSPHLHDYFVSQRGQFKLTAIGNGETLLEGTTWYTIKIYPNFYWQYWSNTIIHKIHFRVLNHIKSTVESKATK